MLKKTQAEKFGKSEGQMSQLSNTEQQEAMEYFSNTIRINNSRQLLLMPKMVTILATLQLIDEDKF